MSRPVPQHGTANRYSYGCRCQPCTKAAVRADAERQLDRLAGNPRLIPSGPAVHHIRALMATGMTFSQISAASGVSAKSIGVLVKGQPSIHARNAEKILAVPLGTRASVGDVPSMGAIRRLRALYALGHPNLMIAQEAVVSRDMVHALVSGKHAKLGVEIDQRVRAAYDRLSMQTGRPGRTRRWAERNGWAPPLAWDDDTIDDPRAVPQVDAVQPVATEGGNVANRWLMGESVILGRTDRREVLAHLYEWTNDTTAEIAARLEMSPEAAERQWERLKERAARDGRRLWRRVYVPRERELKQTEMEEAA